MKRIQSFLKDMVSKMSNMEDIKLKKQIASRLAELINEAYGELADPKTAKLIKRKGTSIDSEVEALMSSGFSERNSHSYFLVFNNLEVELPSGTDFVTYYQSFLIKGIICPSYFNFKNLQELKLVIENFKK